MAALHRLSALALSLLLLVGNAAAVCAGWAATPEARMACCVDGQSCPMHKGEGGSSRDGHGMTQAEADACCALSEPRPASGSTPISSTVVSSPALTPVVAAVPAVVPVVLASAIRSDAPVPLPPVHRHVLLSVFLI